MAEAGKMYPRLDIVDDGISYKDEFYPTDGLDVEYISKMLKEAEDDPRPSMSWEEVKESLRKRFGNDIFD